MSGEAGLGQIFGRGTAAGSHVDLICIVALAQFPVGAADSYGDFFGKGGLAEKPADSLVDFLQGDVATLKFLPQLVRFDKGSIGLGRGGKAVRHPNSLGLQCPDHLSQRGVLTADGRHVFCAEIVEPTDISFWAMSLSPQYASDRCTPVQTDGTESWVVSLL